MGWQQEPAAEDDFFVTGQSGGDIELRGKA
jgi:hypothetical protein